MLYRAPWRPESEWASHYSASIFVPPRVCNPVYPRGPGSATPQAPRRTQQRHRGAVESSVRGGEGGACEAGQKAASNAPYVHLLKALNVSLSVRLRGCCEGLRQRHSPGALHPRRGHLNLLLTMIYVVKVNDCLKVGTRRRWRPYPSDFPLSVFVLANLPFPLSVSALPYLSAFSVSVLVWPRRGYSLIIIIVIIFRLAPITSRPSLPSVGYTWLALSCPRSDISPALAWNIVNLGTEN